MTWQEMIKIEPDLEKLLKEAQAIKDDKRRLSFCANYHWYKPGGLRHELIKLAGWEASNPALCSVEAYDLAYETIYQALPPCRNCTCN